MINEIDRFSLKIVTKIFKVFGVILCGIFLVFGLQILQSAKIEKSILPNFIEKPQRQANKIEYFKTQDLGVATEKWDSSKSACISPTAGEGFGHRFVVNHNYLVASDIHRNQVFIYTRTKDNQWSLNRTIKAPKNSIADQVGSGFGYWVALDEHTLVIGALVKKTTKEITNPQDFPFVFSVNSATTAIYRISLDSTNELERLDTPDNVLPPFASIVADNGIVAFTSLRKTLFNKEVFFLTLLSEDKAKYIQLPKNYDNYRSGRKPFSLAIKDNLLLATSMRPEAGGLAWLLDLDQPRLRFQKLDLPNLVIGNTIALSKYFAVVGAYSQSTWSKDLPNGTVIRGLDNNTTTVMDGYGEVSLENNLLLRMKHLPRGHIGEEILEVYRFESNSVPHPIKKLTGVNKAILQNGFFGVRVGEKICIKQI